MNEKKLYRDGFDQIIVFVKLETGKKQGLAPSRLFSIKRSYVILSLEHWRNVSLFPSGSNYSQPQVFPGLDVELSAEASNVFTTAFYRAITPGNHPRHPRTGVSACRRLSRS